MKNKFTWISWCSLGLLAVTIIAFLLLYLFAKMDIKLDYGYFLELPFILIASYAFIVFWVKTKTMTREHRLPWIFYSVSTFGFSFIILCIVLEKLFPSLSGYSILAPIVLIIGIASFLAVLIGAISEATKKSWKGRSSLSNTFAITWLVLCASYLFTNNNVLAKEVLITVIGSSANIFLCIVIIQKAKAENIGMPYKIILLSLIFAFACSLFNDFFGDSYLDNISGIVFLTSAVVAVDIRTSIWIDESKQKVLPGTKETK